jgi:hypothetical protein
MTQPPSPTPIATVISTLTKTTREWEPIVVCGAARSGTRMIADILNRHAEIDIEAEMHAKTAEAYFAFLDSVRMNFEHYTERKGVPQDLHWQKVQHTLHHVFFATAGKKVTRRTTDKTIRYHGLKTPGYERYFVNFEQMFPVTKPLYIYAKRNVGAVWRSWVAREFTSDLEEFRRRYERSLRQALKIRRSAPDRFALFDLDSYIASADKPDFVARNVLDPLRIPHKIDWPSDGIANSNSAAALGVSLPEGDQMAEQIRSLEADPQISLYTDRLLAPAS